MLATTKKMKRIERKKKKLAALIEIAELNNKDRNEIIETSHLYDSSSDSPNTMETGIKPIGKKKKIEDTPFQSSLDSENNAFDSKKNTSLEEGETNEDVAYSKHKTKKKKKFKHLKEDARLDQGDCKLRTEEITKEEWPILGSSPQLDSHGKKRKSSYGEIDSQKGHPVIIGSTHVHNASGDGLNIMETSLECTEKEEKFEAPPSSCQSSLVNENNTFDHKNDSSLEEGETPEDVAYSKHKTKKKKKSKHPKEDGRLAERNGKSKSEETKEEWPILGSSSQPDSHGQKRKSSYDEVDSQKERPVKMVKCQNEYLPTALHNRTYEKEFNYADELANFRRDVKRKLKTEKKIEEKKNKKFAPDTEININEELESSTQSDEKVQCGKINYEGEMEELRRLMKERKKQLKALPYLRLKGVGKEAELSGCERTPILPGDVQNLLLLSQMGLDCPRFPRWVELKKFNRLSKTVVLVVEGVSAYDLYSQESSCPTLSQMDVKVEMVSPYCYNAGVPEELCAVPITRQQKKILEKRYGKVICPEALLTDRIIKVLRSAFSISSVSKTHTEEVEQKISVPSTDKFPRTELLLSVWQLIEEGYPLPYGGSDLGNRYPDYVMTKEEYKEVTPSSPMWGLDCEMCLTKAGNELTRVSVVNEQHKTVYESLCVPPNPIINYLTEFSGITAKMLKGVTTRLEDIQRDLRELFPPDVILVGQSLGGDLHALKMMHPYVIDTSVIFNLTGNRKHKSKLSKLSLEFLNEAIQQQGADGHDSVEDSLAALKLVQLKLSKNIAYGDAVLSGLKEDSMYHDSNSENRLNSSYPEHSAEEFKDLQIEVGPTMATSLFKHVTMRNRAVAVIGQEETLAEYSTFVAAAHLENKQLVRTHVTTSNAETINLACRECKNNNFTLSHVVLSDEEDLVQVDSWMKRLFDSPPFNSLFIVVLAGSHNSFSNGACLAKIKRPNLKLKTRKAD